MKDNKSKMGFLVTAALLGASSVASAGNCDDPQETFVPIESLAPQDRVMLNQRLELLSQSAKIDWNTVVLGTNEKGELILRSRKTYRMPVEGNNPTCLSITRPGQEEK